MPFNQTSQPNPHAPKVGFSPSLGGTICSLCLAEDPKYMPINQGTLAVWKLLSKIDIRKLNRLKLSKNELLALETILQSFMEYQIEQKMNTIDFIRQLKKMARYA
jgi:recombinational DNA repair protein (RecF pathway)